MTKLEQIFRQFGGRDLEKYLLLGVPGEWEEAVIDQLTSKARERMEQCLRETPPEFSSHGQRSMRRCAS